MNHSDDTPDFDADSAEEQWRAKPEDTDVGAVPAFGLYFLLKIPDGECFDGSVSVGVTVPSPDEGPAEHRPNVVLGYTGDSGVRLTNVLLQPEEARQLAGHLVSAAVLVETHEAIHAPTPEEQREYMARLARAVLPKMTDEQLIAGGLSEDQVRQLHNTHDESN